MKRAVYFFLGSLLVLVFIQPLFQPYEPYRIRQVKPYASVLDNELVQLQSNQKAVRIYLNTASLSEQVQDTELLELWNQALEQKLVQAGYQVYYTDHQQVESQSLKDQIFLSFSFRVSTSKEPGITLFTRPRNSYLESLSTQIGFQLQKTNLFAYLGVDTDHYENFPSLNPEQSLLIQISYPEGSLKRLSSEPLIDAACQAVSEAFLLTPEL